MRRDLKRRLSALRKFDGLPLGSTFLAFLPELWRMAEDGEDPQAILDEYAKIPGTNVGYWLGLVRKYAKGAGRV